jgi:hypothetical protein
MARNSSSVMRFVPVMAIRLPSSVDQMIATKRARTAGPLMPAAYVHAYMQTQTLPPSPLNDSLVTRPIQGRVDDITVAALSAPSVPCLASGSRVAENRWCATAKAGRGAVSPSIRDACGAREPRRGRRKRRLTASEATFYDASSKKHHGIPGFGPRGQTTRHRVESRTCEGNGSAATRPAVVWQRPRLRAGQHVGRGFLVHRF